VELRRAGGRGHACGTGAPARGVHVGGMGRAPGGCRGAGLAAAGPARPRAPPACTSAASIVYVHTVILWQLGMVPRLAAAADVRPGWSARGVLHLDPGMAGWPSPVSGQGPWPSRRGLQRAVGHRLPGTALNHGPADAALGREEPGWHATAAQAGSSHQEQRWARDVPVGMCAASPPPGVAALELQAAVWARDGYVPHRPVLVLHGSSGDCYGRGGQQGANAASVRHRSAARLQRRRSGGLCARCAVAVC